MDSVSRKVVVTGSKGFIGRHLMEALNRRPAVEVRGFDIDSSPKVLAEALRETNVVFHLAGIVGTTELLSRNFEAIDTNIKGTVNVLDACIRHGVGTVFYPTKPNVWLNTYSITKK